MNRFFDLEEWRRGYPSRAYARLDDLEPIAQDGENDLSFAFDAVDADWKGFGAGGPFDLNDPALADRIQTRWKRNLGGGGDGFDGPDPYDELPVYRIEFSLARDHRWFEATPRTEEPWVALSLTDEESDVPAMVYGGLFAPPIRAFLHLTPSRSAPSAALDALFDMKDWPTADPEALLDALQPRCEVESLVCFDIGQGSASALVCRCGYPIYYFDVGCGSGRNAPTAPARVDFCTCEKPPVILSHWDTDHWAGAHRQKALHASTWIVPRQKISATHTLLANDILKAGGSVLVVDSTMSPIRWTAGTQHYDLQICTGPGRNGSGLALVVTNYAFEPSPSWVLTGDAAYNYLPHPTPNHVVGLIAPHHGADMGVSSTPYPRPTGGYARLLYSFGPDNAHGPKKPPTRHPTSAAVQAHTAKSWNHGAWTPSAAALTVAAADVLATATHTVTHLSGAAATWNGARPPLGHLSSCPHALPVTQW